MKSFSLPKISENLYKNKFKIKKSLGQNFIFDLNLTNKIVKNSMPFSKTIIEIGPGPGTLTRSILCNGGKNVFVIEKDKDSIKLLDPLKKLFPSELNVIFSDALNYPLWDLGSYPRQIIANLPYNISTKILIKLLQNIDQFDKFTLMFQKEVALRLIAKPGQKFYGRLSVLVQLLANAKIIFDIPKNAFVPKPKITSSVVTITPLKNKPFKFKFNDIEKITHFTFSKRRKMLRTIFKNYGGTEMLKEINISPNLRPENLTIDEYCKLANKIF